MVPLIGRIIGGFEGAHEAAAILSELFRRGRWLLKCIHSDMRIPMSRRIVADVAPLARVFKALGDETRIRIVALLSHGELCVCHVEEALGLSQPNASRQLGVLHRAGVVERRRVGSWVYFKLARQSDPASREQLDRLARGFAGEEPLRRDVARLLASRGPGACK